MRRVKRGKQPASLTKSTELTRAKAYHAGRAAGPAPVASATTAISAGGGAGTAKAVKKKKFVFSAYKAADVRRSLENVFHGKCAYCESRYATTAPVDIEHYRPKGRVLGDTSHPGYWWLAMSWENLLPACIDCNRRRKQSTPKATGALMLTSKGRFSSSRIAHTGKGDAFPIAGTRLPALSTAYSSEQALLLDPCTDFPDQHLEFYIDRKRPLGLVLPKARAGGAGPAVLPPLDPGADWGDVRHHAITHGLSERGAVSIQVYGLNRLSLVRERTRILHRLEFLELQITKIDEAIRELGALHCGSTCIATKAKAIACLQTMHDGVLQQIREMAEDDSPYSAMVKAWCRDFVHRASL